MASKVVWGVWVDGSLREGRANNAAETRLCSSHMFSISRALVAVTLAFDIHLGSNRERDTPFIEASNSVYRKLHEDKSVIVFSYFAALK